MRIGSEGMRKENARSRKYHHFGLELLLSFAPLWTTFTLSWVWDMHHPEMSLVTFDNKI